MEEEYPLEVLKLDSNGHLVKPGMASSFEFKEFDDIMKTKYVVVNKRQLSESLINHKPPPDLIMLDMDYVTGMFLDGDHDEMKAINTYLGNKDRDFRTLESKMIS